MSAKFSFAYIYQQTAIYIDERSYKIVFDSESYFYEILLPPLSRSSPTLFNTVNRVGLDQKRWAEDIAWHPHRSELFSVYTADEGHAQVSALYLNEAREVKRVYEKLLGTLAFYLV